MRDLEWKIVWECQANEVYEVLLFRAKCWEQWLSCQDEVPHSWNPTNPTASNANQTKMITAAAGACFGQASNPCLPHLPPAFTAHALPGNAGSPLPVLICGVIFPSDVFSHAFTKTGCEGDSPHAGTLSLKDRKQMNCRCTFYFKPAAEVKPSFRPASPSAFFCMVVAPRPEFLGSLRHPAVPPALKL